MYVLNINAPNMCLSLYVCESNFVMTSLQWATLLLWKTSYNKTHIRINVTVPLSLTHTHTHQCMLTTTHAQ